MEIKLLKLSALVVPVLLAGSACNTTRTADNAARSAEEGTRARTNDAKFAYVRFVDAYSKPADLFFGDEKLATGEYKSVTDYKRVAAERQQFSLRGAAGMTGDPLAKNSEGLDDGHYYTVVAWDEDANNSKEGANMRVVNDNEKAPASGKAKVRIIHASPHTAPVDLYVSGRKDKIAGLSRLSASSNWDEVDAVTGPLEVRIGDDRTPVKVTNVTLQPGKLYTFVVMGDQKNGGKVSVVPLIDEPKS